MRKQHWLILVAGIIEQLRYEGASGDPLVQTLCSERSAGVCRSVYFTAWKRSGLWSSRTSLTREGCVVFGCLHTANAGNTRHFPAHPPQRALNKPGPARSVRGAPHCTLPRGNAGTVAILLWVPSKPACPCTAPQVVDELDLKMLGGPSCCKPLSQLLSF